MGEDRDERSRQGERSGTGGGSALGRALSRRVPVWLVIGAVVVVAGSLGLALFIERRSSVELGPAVGSAERIEVQMTLCNRDVDRLDLNPRHAELDLEDVLRQEGARNADVRVDRRDCPRAEASGGGE